MKKLLLRSKVPYTRILHNNIFSPKESSRRHLVNNNMDQKLMSDFLLIHSPSSWQFVMLALPEGKLASFPQHLMTSLGPIPSRLFLCLFSIILNPQKHPV